MKQLVEAPFTRLWMMMIVASLVINVTLNATVSSAEMLKSLQRPVLSQPKVGDSYGGGIIIYLNATGQHGLIASATDVATANNWYDAKMICNDFLNGYGDWFLPTSSNLTRFLSTRMPLDIFQMVSFTTGVQQRQARLMHGTRILRQAFKKPTKSSKSVMFVPCAPFNVCLWCFS